MINPTPLSLSRITHSYSHQCSPTSSTTSTPIKPSRLAAASSSSGAGPALPPRRPAAAAPKISPAAAPAPVAAAAATAAAAAAAATTAAAVTTTKQTEEPEMTALKHAAEVAIEQTEAAVAADDVEGAAHAAETLEDVVDDQIHLANEEALEAVAGLFGAAAEAQEAAEDAEDVLSHAPAKEEEKPATVASVVEEKKKPKAGPKLPQRPAAAAASAAAASAAAASAAAASAAVVIKKQNAGTGGTAAEEVSHNGTAATSVVAEEKEEPTSKETRAATEEEKAEEAVAVTEEEAQEEEEGKQQQQFAFNEPMTDEAEDQYETLDSIPHPTLNFDNAPDPTQELNDIEDRIRKESLDAHKLIKDNQLKIDKAAKAQGEALELALGEGSGRVRPTLLAACAFALADMTLAQHKVNETKVALATAYDAAGHVENKGAVIRALMNYAYILRSENKPRSTRSAYTTAMEIAVKEHGPSHPTVEQVKFEFTSFLVKTGRVEDAVQVLLTSAEALSAEAERLDKEEGAKEAEKKEEETKDPTVVDDPGTGMEHLRGEVEEEEETVNPAERARHYAMRALINAGSYLDIVGKHEEAESTLNRAMEAAVAYHGEKSLPHLNTLCALGSHYRRQARIQEAIDAYESALTIMDETIEVYEPDLLQTRVQILRDTASLYDKAGEPALAVDYATGALVNMKTLVHILEQVPGSNPMTGVAMLEPFYQQLADLKTKAGDVDGAAAAKRDALRARLNAGQASRGGRRGMGGGGRGGATRGKVRR